MKKKTPSRNLRPVVLVILAVLAGGIGVRFERSGTRFELHIGKSA
ncbi:hypothetical protein [Archangium gephyra]|uniref:Uncharacterized protein n=1 Tax=Archangium gephyra TaxID=48 RepID=A0AAC8Q5C1_9BACT|nr:hypothetical protein [Archangium gephyra]AKJ01271.1 Hypothetical protein AA314_02897 [Archangium gephyra]